MSKKWIHSFILILTLLVVFAFSQVQAYKITDEIEEDETEGSAYNPFDITIDGGSGRSKTFHYESLPFYFKTSAPGAYEIELNTDKQEVTFRLIENNVERITVAGNEEYTEASFYQFGVQTRANTDQNMVVQNTYKVNEILLYSENNVKKVMRLFPLSNVIINANFAATRGDVFFFTNFTDTLKQEIHTWQETAVDVSVGSIVWSMMLFGDTSALTTMKNATPEGIMYEFNGVGSPSSIDRPAARSSIEALVTRIFVKIGDDFLIAGLRKIFGNNLSINTLIFDQFEMTKVDFYNKEATGNNAAIRNAVNKWYKIFLSFTYIAYMIILVYIGIMVIVTSGTPRQSKAKSFFTNWVVGLLILAFVPYFGFPLLFKLNEAFVAYVGKDANSMETYFTVAERHNEVLGGDSMTTLVEKLEAKKSREEARAQAIQNLINTNIERINNDIVTAYVQYLEDRAHQTITTERRNSISTSISNWLKYRYELYARYRDNNSATHEQGMQYLSGTVYQDKGYLISEEVYNYIIDHHVIESFSERFKDLYTKNQQIQQIEEDILVVQNDILGIMRINAGYYQRLIFAALFMMLIFQLVGLLFLYIKRMLMLGILIAIFPIIMLFYCIDKMADGTAQTLSLWFKEFLANIFIQSIHAVIYRVLVEMGMQVFQRDNGNWILLACAMLLILPAESIMKEVFGLNGISLGKIGGKLEAFAKGVGAMVGFAAASKWKGDKSISNKEKKFANNMQRKENRSADRAERRNLKRTANNAKEDSFMKSAKNAAYNIGDKMQDLGKNLRKDAVKLHNAKNKVENHTRRLRNAAAITTGVAYGIAGGDTESMWEGAAMAKTLSGKQDKGLKEQLTHAYERHGKTENKNKGDK